jgi:hypothetical protein
MIKYKNKCGYFLQTEVEFKQTLENFAKKTPIKRSKHLINIVFDLKDDSRKRFLMKKVSFTLSLLVWRVLCLRVEFKNRHSQAQQVRMKIGSLEKFQ